MERYTLFLFLALLSEIIGTVSGFGSSILFVPIAALFFDFKSVLAITAVFHVFSNISKIALFRNGVDKQIVIKLGVPAIIFVSLGAWITTFLPTKPIELLMCIALVLLSVYLLIHFNRPLQKTDTNLYVGGATSGFVAGVAGTGGAIRGIVLAAFHLPKNVFIATSAFIDLGVDSSRAVIYLTSGYFHSNYWIFIPGLVVVSFVGSYLGKVVLRFTSENLFRYIVLFIIIASSLYQIARFYYN